MTRLIYRFDNCRIDPAVRELWRGERLISLPPYVFDCLAYLIEHRERAVGRDELVSAVWGRTEVSDTQLGQTVLRIRRELGDDAKDQRIVRTIPRFGYRWVAALEVGSEPFDIPASAAAPVPGPVEPSEAVKARSRRLARPAQLAWLGGIALTSVLALCVWEFRVKDERAAQDLTSEPRSVGGMTAAVLPAAVEQGADWSWMRLGVMDVVAGRLRSSGVPSVPSENIIALLNGGKQGAEGSLRAVTQARLVISPRAHRADSGWEVDLDADDGAGQHYAAQAQANDVTQAARAATDKLLLALGQQPPTDGADAAPYATLVKRVDAAILSDDPTAALGLIQHASPEEQRSPELRLRLAKMDFRAGRLDQARERLKGLLAEAPAQTSPVMRASVLNGLGAVAVRSDEPAQAEQAFAEAVSLLQDRSEPAQLGEAYLGRAAAATDQHHFDAAEADYARARIALRQANDTLALIRVAADEGFLDLEQDRPAQALSQLSTATAGFIQWGALNEAVFTYIGQISCDLALLDARAAMTAADAADTLAQRIDNPATLNSLAIARARALAGVGRIREARDVLDRLRSGSRPEEVTAAVATVVLSRLELDAEHSPAARDLAEQAAATLARPEYAGARADAWLIAARASMRVPDPSRVAAHLAALESWAGQTGNRHAQLSAQLVRAEQTWHFGDAGQWRAQFNEARKIAEHTSMPVDIAAVARSFSDALLADGDLETAAVEVGRLSRWSEQDFACAVLEARLYAAMGRNEARQAALARARSLAGERPIPGDALAVPISTEAASAR